MITVNYVKTVGQNVSTETHVCQDYSINFGYTGLEMATGAWCNEWNRLLFKKFKVDKRIDYLDVIVRYGKDKLGKAKTFKVSRDGQFNPQSPDKHDKFAKYMEHVDKLIETEKVNTVSIAIGDTDYLMTIGQFEVVDVSYVRKGSVNKKSEK